MSEFLALKTFRVARRACQKSIYLQHRTFLQTGVTADAAATSAPIIGSIKTSKHPIGGVRGG